MAFLPQGSVGQIAGAFENNPGALQQRYGVTKQLVDLMALQRINAEQQAIARQMEMDLEQQAASAGLGAPIADQVATETFDNTTKNIAQMAGLGGILNERNAQAGGQPPPPGPMPQGINQVPAPNMERMSGGGIVAFADGAEVEEEEQQKPFGTPDWLIKLLEMLFPSVSQEQFDKRPRGGSDEWLEQQYIRASGIPTPQMEGEEAERWRKNAGPGALPGPHAWTEEEKRAAEEKMLSELARLTEETEAAQRYADIALPRASGGLVSLANGDLVDDAVDSGRLRDLQTNLGPKDTNIALLYKMLDAEGVTDPEERAFIQAIYEQESSSGTDSDIWEEGGGYAKSANMGEMQMSEAARRELERLGLADEGELDLNTREGNIRGGIRYALLGLEKAGRDFGLAATFYYGGYGGLEAAESGQARYDPDDPNMPSTFGYRDEVSDRMNEILGTSSPTPAEVADSGKWDWLKGPMISRGWGRNRQLAADIKQMREANPDMSEEEIWIEYGNQPPVQEMAEVDAARTSEEIAASEAIEASDVQQDDPRMRAFYEALGTGTSEETAASQAIVASDVGDGTDIVEALNDVQQDPEKSGGRPFYNPEGFIPYLKGRWQYNRQIAADIKEIREANPDMRDEELWDIYTKVDPNAGITAQDYETAGTGPNVGQTAQGYADATAGVDPDMRAFYETMGGDKASEAWEESGGLQALNAQGTTTEPSGPRINWDELSDFLTSAQGTTTGSALAAGAQGSKTGRHAREALDRDERLQYAKIEGAVRQIELRMTGELDQIKAEAKANMAQEDRDAVDAAYDTHALSILFINDMERLGMDKLDQVQQDLAMADYVMKWYHNFKSGRAMGMEDYTGRVGPTEVVDTGT